MSALGFYTYEHTRNDTGAVFYVGKGRGKRAKEGDVGNMSRWHFNNCKQKEL